jgi:hypothetical protein
MLDSMVLRILELFPLSVTPLATLHINCRSGLANENDNELRKTPTGNNMTQDRLSRYPAAGRLICNFRFIPGGTRIAQKAAPIEITRKYPTVRFCLCCNERG